MLLLNAVLYLTLNEKRRQLRPFKEHLCERSMQLVQQTNQKAKPKKLRL